MSSVFAENLDRLAPGRRLGRADLTQIQNVELHHAAAVEALVLDDAPVAVRLAILLPQGLPQKHDVANLARQTRRWERGRSSLQPFSTVVHQDRCAITNGYRTASGPRIAFPGANPRRRADSTLHWQKSQELCACSRFLPCAFARADLPTLLWPRSSQLHMLSIASRIRRTPLTRGHREPSSRFPQRFTGKDNPKCFSKSGHLSTGYKIWL